MFYLLLCFSAFWPSQNTSGESKASVYKRIGSTVLPEFSLIDPTATGDRVKSKLET